MLPFWVRRTRQLSDPLSPTLGPPKAGGRGVTRRPLAFSYATSKLMLLILVVRTTTRVLLLTASGASAARGFAARRGVGTDLQPVAVHTVMSSARAFLVM